MNNSMNNSMANSMANFPIGTFSIEQTTQQPPSVAAAAQQPFPTTDYFNPNAMANMSSGNGMNGTGSTHFNNASNNMNHINNNHAAPGTGDQPGQATRETGIIEKLLVS